MTGRARHNPVSYEAGCFRIRDIAIAENTWHGALKLGGFKPTPHRLNHCETVGFLS
jgi:hypothetical protein